MHKRDYEKEYQSLDFTNDFLFCKIMTTNLELCRKVLEVILDVSIKEVKLVESQKSITITGDGRGVRLDVYLNDDKGTVYDLEMQRKYYPDMPKRTRYYRGMIDLNMIEKGISFSELRKTITIFICLSDPYNQQLYRYTFQNMCLEVPGLNMGDETETVFLNAGGIRGEVSDELKEFLGFLKDGVAKNELCESIDDAVENAKIHEKWRVEYMTLMMRDEEMKAEGKAEGKAEVATAMFRMNMPMEQIAKATNLPMDLLVTIKQRVESEEER